MFNKCQVLNVTTIVTLIGPTVFPLAGSLFSNLHCIQRNSLSERKKKVDIGLVWSMGTRHDIIIGSCSSCSEEKSAMVPNPDPK